MGAGNDTVTINGAIKNTDINLGTGQDLLIFGGDIRNGINVNLGSDGQVDIIEIAQNAKIKGLKIDGAESGDILFIGSIEYQYNPLDNTWVSDDDVRKF